MSSRTIPRAFDVIGKASATAAVSVDGNPATRLDEFFYKELPAGSGSVHVPYVVQATDAIGTTTRNGGKFLPATPEVFGHDFDGNLTSDGRFTYTWDAENRLAAMETHATIPLPARRKLAFAYDAMGRRIRKTVWHGTGGGGWQLHHQFDFIHEPGGWNILAERSGGSSNSFLRTYTWGTDLSGSHNGAGGVGGLLFSKLHTSGTTFAHGMDLNGNVTLLVNAATGQSAATYDYGPFGEPLRQSGEYANLNPFRFSTKYVDDESGLVAYELRYYIPSSGAWLNRDLIEENGGVNLYGFVRNNGVMGVDLNGLMTVHYGFTTPSSVLVEDKMGFTGIAGITQFDGDVNCEVRGCKIECTIIAASNILMNTAVNANGTNQYNQALNHEKMHVMSWASKIKSRVVGPLLSEDDRCDTEAECAEKSKRLEKRYIDVLDEQAGGGDHHGDQNSTAYSPRAGIPYGQIPNLTGWKQDMERGKESGSSDEGYLMFKTKNRK